MKKSEDPPPVICVLRSCSPHTTTHTKKRGPPRERRYFDSHEVPRERCSRGHGGETLLKLAKGHSNGVRAQQALHTDRIRIARSRIFKTARGQSTSPDI